MNRSDKDMNASTRTAEQIVVAVMASGLWEMQERLARQQAEEYAIIICDLTGTKGIGRAIAQALNGQHYVGRDPSENIWTFLYPVQKWQEFRREMGRGPDNFSSPVGGQPFVVVQDSRVLTGRGVPVQRQPQRFEEAIDLLETYRSYSSVSPHTSTYRHPSVSSQPSPETST